METLSGDGIGPPIRISDALSFNWDQLTNRKQLELRHMIVPASQILLITTVFGIAHLPSQLVPTVPFLSLELAEKRRVLRTVYLPLELSSKHRFAVCAKHPSFARPRMASAVWPHLVSETRWRLQLRLSPLNQR
jgi:hypothetical protein